MPPLRVIRRRIRTVQNIVKVTRSMEMIAASKMRRTQARALATRPYDEKMREVLADLAAQPYPGETLHPLLQHRPIAKVAIIHITTDRGLCGGLNAAMNRHTAAFILEMKMPVQFVAVGRKGRDFLARTGQEIRAEFTRIGDQPGVEDAWPIARIGI